MLPHSSLYTGNVTGWTARSLGSVLSGDKTFFSWEYLDQLCGLPGLHLMGTGALSLWVKWPGCEADGPTPFGSKVMSEWSCVSSPPYAFMAHMRTTLDSVICIATSLQVWRCGVRILAETGLFSWPKRSDRLWGPPSFLVSGYSLGFLPGSKGNWGVKLTCIWCRN